MFFIFLQNKVKKIVTLPSKTRKDKDKDKDKDKWLFT